MPRRGGADRELAQLDLARRVEQHVVGHDQMCVGGDPQVADVDAAAPQPVDLAEQDARVEHDPVADHAGLVRVEDPRGNQVELELLAVADDRVAGVVAALEAHDRARALGEQVGDLALALVAPLGADYDDARHNDKGLCHGYCAAPSRCATPARAGPSPNRGQRVVADLDQARDSARADLVLELLPALVDVVTGVAGDQHRALVLVALVDQRVELLDAPSRCGARRRGRRCRAGRPR